ncbi:MAG: malto-oligosyltrehalose synthase [Actinomycetota bacterium]|nr:malto-oligosyltrehalose synthase [Actinomycetota bacterium]
MFYRGKKSEYSKYFDIDWNHPSPQLKSRLLAPFLGQAHHKAFSQGKIKVVLAPEGLCFKYYQHLFPLSLNTYSAIFNDSAPPQLKDLLPEPDIARLYKLYNSDSKIKNYIDQLLGKINQDSSLYFSLAHKQNFRLSYYKMANELINYRQFFTINHLISAATERKEVFDYMHQALEELARKKIIQGGRVDHIDGLYNPLQYLKRLKSCLGLRFIVVEKILGQKENLPAEWPVYGTTGYDYLNQLNGIFCNTRNQAAFDRIYKSFTGNHEDFGSIAYQAKKMILEKHMQGDLDNLARQLLKTAPSLPDAQDFSPRSLTAALTALLSAFPVYRTYVNTKASPQDQKFLNQAVRQAAARQPHLVGEIKFIARLFKKTGHKKFKARFQQLTGPLMAKGFEDTLLYKYNRLLSLNEVGSSPDKFGIGLTDFYHFCQNRQSDWPRSLNATSTHDTKRGEDARLRLNVLSEIPGRWQQRLKLWKKLNQSKRTRVGNSFYPDPNDEYFLYQAMIGAWTSGPRKQFKSRMQSYIVKAVREAKVHTAWIRPDNRYEKAFILFFNRLTEDSRFMDDFSHWVTEISYFQSFSSLSQVLIKITSPGIPDFYQGTELEDFSLVDPDNRRPVNYGQRIKMLQYIEEKRDSNNLAGQILDDRQSSLAKLFLIYKALQARTKYQNLFIKGDFKPLPIKGRFKYNIIAFSRNLGSQSIITIAPRFFTQLVSFNQRPLGRAVYQDTRTAIPYSNLYNLLTGEKIESGNIFIGDILKDFPVAMLHAEGGSYGKG